MLPEKQVLGAVLYNPCYLENGGKNISSWQGACVRREGSRCEQTEAAIKKPIAAPALTVSGTRPPLRNLCVLPAVHAAVGDFLRRRGALCTGRCTLGRLFGLRDAARPRTCRYAVAQSESPKSGVGMNQIAHTWVGIWH